MENPRPNSDSAEPTKISIERLARLLRGLASSFRIDLTNETSQIYIAALMDLSPEILQKAIAKGVKSWVFFPSVAEILDVVDAVSSDPVAHARARKKVFEKYEQLYLAGYQPPQLKSATEDDMRALAAQVMSREERVKAGIEHPKQLTQVEWDARLKELRKQAEKLVVQELFLPQLNSEHERKF